MTTYGVFIKNIDGSITYRGSKQIESNFEYDDEECIYEIER